MIQLDEYLDMHGMHDKPQRELARHFDVTQTTVGRWINRGDVVVELDVNGRDWTRVYTPVQKKAPG